ncbi:N-acetylmuramidase [Rhizobium ruizarguesonis]|uniref:glycoside hydrolase family 108 protein n=1 Tax=Rhizobium ruizarguesonis TaxID=2081791 RepID=UPI0010309148|nr:glycoside hydrolase family 108 protein [Rhizobium ruizarguesonis]TAZ20785.1 N-acetylmuramidase [Rhizobium ruizarguesonis]
MAAKNFEEALARVLVHEGGYVDDPRDPGGATNQGVTQRTYDAYRRSKKLSTRPVKLMTGPERNEIYRRQYWDAVQGDTLPDGLDYVLLDGAVHSGPKQSIKWLQRALGASYHGTVDGVIGLATFAALGDTTNYSALIDRICDRRLAFLKTLDGWPHFGNGWKRRVANVRAVAKADVLDIKNPSTVLAVPLAGGEAKARIEDARRAPSKTPGDAATGGGLGGLTMAGILQTLQEQLTPYSAAGGWIGKFVIILAVSGALLAIGGIAYRWYANRQRAKIADALDAVPA